MHECCFLYSHLLVHFLCFLSRCVVSVFSQKTSFSAAIPCMNVVFLIRIFNYTCLVFWIGVRCVLMFPTRFLSVCMQASWLCFRACMLFSLHAFFITLALICELVVGVFFKKGIFQYTCLRRGLASMLECGVSSSHRFLLLQGFWVGLWWVFFSTNSSFRIHACVEASLPCMQGAFLIRILYYTCNVV